MNRRQFMQTAAGAAALLAMRQKALAFYRSSARPLWGTQLRGVGPGGIPVAAPDAFQAPVTGVTHYTMNIGQFMDDIGGGGPTTLWGFHPANPLGGGTQPPKHLGGIIVAKRGDPIQITFHNKLPDTDPHYPGGHDTPGCQPSSEPHRHAHSRRARTMDQRRGPFDWWAPNGTHGESFLNNQMLNPGAATMRPSTTIPTTRARAPVVPRPRLGHHPHQRLRRRGHRLCHRDKFEERAMKTKGLPRVHREQRSGTAPHPRASHRYPGQDLCRGKRYRHLGSHVGSLERLSNHAGQPGTRTSTKRTLETPSGGRHPAAQSIGSGRKRSATPCWSTAPLPPGGPWRRDATGFNRILNACNARFLNLQMYVDDGTPNGITLDPKTGVPLNKPFRNPAAPSPAGTASPCFLVLGNEAGFLPNAVRVPSNVPFNLAAMGGSLILGPAERSDVVVDFSQQANQKLILYTDAPSPFPFGSPIFDHFPGWNIKGNPGNALTPAGSGPNTRIIMRFNVGAPSSITDPPLTITPGTDLSEGNDPLLVPLGSTVLPAGVFVRQLTLNEDFDAFGRLIQLQGTNIPLVSAKAGFGRDYLAAATEVTTKDALEVWQIANLTGDTHPIHFHLVNVQILSRQPFSSHYSGVPHLKGDPVPPAPEEAGWKETVRMHPGEVTTVIMQFKLPRVPVDIPTTPRDAANGSDPGLGLTLPPGAVANEYVWHCHILEHEEHDMMRPLVVIGQAPLGVAPTPQTITRATGGDGDLPPRRWRATLHHSVVGPRKLPANRGNSRRQRCWVHGACYCRRHIRRSDLYDHRLE